MKRMLALAGLFLTLSAPLLAQGVLPISPLLSFQGRIAKPDGTPVPDNTPTVPYTIRFSLYDAPTGGNLKWTQTVTGINVRNGVFTALLNLGTEYATILNGDLYMEIKVGNDAPLSPRQPVLATAFALKANTVPDNSITTAKIANGAVTNVKIGSVDWSKLINVPPTLLTLPYSGTANTSGNAFAVTNNNGTGIYGKGRFAVYGEGGQYGGFFQSDSDNFGYAVYAQNTVSGDYGALGIANVGLKAGVYGVSTNGFGVFGKSTSNYGVLGESTTTYGVVGSSRDFVGVYGLSTNSDGVNGRSTAVNTAGVTGNNPNGYGIFGVGGTHAGYFVGTVFSTGGYIDASDERYKTNITPLENPLATILNMRGVTYDWKRDDFKEMNFGPGRQIGFIAQELEKVLPELVHTDSKGYKSVNYSHVVPILVEAVKTLKKDNDGKQKQIDELRTQVNALLEAVRQLQEQRK